MTELLPSVLVGLVHVDEPTVERARLSVRQQKDVRTTLFELANLPKRVAHERLYSRFMAEAPGHNLLVKVDGDMVIAHQRLFAAASTIMREHSTLDYLAVGVDDWFSGQRIFAMNFWRPGVQWKGRPGELATDLIETDVREDLKVLDTGQTLVTHGENPTPTQAIRYGAHRALKARASLKAHRIHRTLEFVRWTERNPDGARLLAVAAIESALSDPEIGLHFTSGDVEDHHIDRLRMRSQQADLAPATIRLLQELDERRIVQSVVESSKNRISVRSVGRSVGRMSRAVRSSIPRSRSVQRDLREERFIELLGSDNDRAGG